MKRLNMAIAACALLTITACAGPELRATTQQIRDVEGTYQLDNGQRATVLTLDNRLYIDIGTHRQELVLGAPNRFQTLDGAIAMQFDPDAPGDKILLVYRRGDAQPIPVLLAAGQHRGHGSVD